MCEKQLQTPAVSSRIASSSDQNNQEMNVDMEKNSSTLIACIEERKEWLINISEEKLEPQPECCIYRVPKDLRKMNEEAYTPKVVSIGPLHHGIEELADMEKQKIRYKREFRKRITIELWHEFIIFIEKHEQHIRNCYEETSKLQKLEFISMILYDAVFIIELFLKDYYKDESDFLLNKPRVRAAIWLDLQLLENQLPYFILEELYMLAFSNSSSSEEGYPSFFLLSCAFLYDNMFKGLPVKVEIKHFTDLRRHVITKMYPKPQSRELLFIDLPRALDLQKSGIMFKRIEGECLLDIRFERKKQWIPFMEACELHIPRIDVYDETESLIRNVMALEQCHYPFETHVCNYIYLMDFLIDTEEDVNVLSEAGIISNHVGDNATVAQMFNKLGLQIDLSYSCYYDIFKNLKAHYDNRWNHAKATLKSVYFSNLWRGTGTVAAVILLLLTLVQTICSILQVL